MYSCGSGVHEWAGWHGLDVRVSMHVFMRLLTLQRGSEVGEDGSATRRHACMSFFASGTSPGCFGRLTGHC